jgi:hypothetical protein
MAEIKYGNNVIRAEFDKTSKVWWFSAVDFVLTLSNTSTAEQARKNWNTTKKRQETIQLSSNCRQLKLRAADGKFYNSDVLNSKGVIALASVLKYSDINALIAWLDSLSGDEKRYILRHKDIDVATVELDENAEIASIGKIHNENHLPIGTLVKDTLSRKLLNDWWKGRTIPASREGIRELLDAFHLDTSEQLVEKCFGLSLSDQYWISPIADDLKWSDINFFQNAFSEDVGNMLFNAQHYNNEDLNAVSLLSPDNTSDGMLKKKWKIVSGKRCLIKGGSNESHQEVANEVLASLICQRLDIPFVKYDAEEIDGEWYSVCEDFVTSDTELVTAWHIKNLIDKRNDTNDYDSFIMQCTTLGIADAALRIDQMLTLDFIIANTDRHYNNFGLIRNANTLKWLRFAPIYDSGTAMWCKEFSINAYNDKIESKPFRKYHSTQIQLVKDFSWLDLTKLDGIEIEYAAILEKVIPHTPDFAARNKKLCAALRQRIELLAKIVRKKGGN